MLKSLETCKKSVRPAVSQLMATFLVAGLLISHVEGSPPPRQRLEQKSTSSASSSTSRTPPFYVLDPEYYRSYFPDEASFRLASSVAPLLDLPATDDEYGDVLTAYYYRIRSYRKHLRRSDDDKYWVVTEFLPPVPWAGSSNTISAAAGHHISEGRWFWDAPEFVEDYIRFWYLGGGGRKEDSPIVPAAYSRRLSEAPQPHISQYTNWIYHAAWQYASLWGFDDRRRSLFRDTFQNAASVFRDVYVEQYLTNSTRNSAAWNSSGRVCWTQDDGKDAMEVSVSGSGCRPTIASAMWGEAMALAQTAALLGEKEEVIQEFQQWASFSRNVITQQHWNPAVKSFAVIPPSKPSDSSLENVSQNPNQRGPNCDLLKIRTPNQPVNVRELLAFMPWYYSSLLQPRDNNTNNSETETMFAKQFQWLLESSGDDGFTGPWGLRTVQRSAPCYNFSWDHGDCWNGPSWPYETSRVLTAVANLLTERDVSAIEESGMTPREFERLLLQYALQHTRTSAANDTARPLHSGHIFENVHPDLGYWNNRERMYWRNDRNRNMGDDYNHSTFLDLILGSWLGIRMSTSTADNTPWLVIHPLIQAPYFAFDRIPYRGRVLSVVYDPTGTRYSSTAQTNSAIRGLAILVDGRVVAQRPDIGRLVVPVEPQS